MCGQYLFLLITCTILHKEVFCSTHKRELIEKYQSFQKLEYLFAELPDFEKDLSNVSTNELKSYTDDVYNKLTCSYIFNMMTHLSTLGSLLQYKKSTLSILTPAEIDGVAFKKQIIGMLVAAHEWKLFGVIKQLWLLFVFMSKLENYFKSIKDRTDAERSKLISIDCIIDEIIEDASFVNKCKTRQLGAKDKSAGVPIKSNKSEKKSTSNTDPKVFFILVGEITKHNTLVDAQNNTNAKQLNVQWHVTFDNLLLNHLPGDATAMSQLTAELSKYIEQCPISDIRKSYEIAIDFKSSLGDQVQAICDMHKNFIAFLKIIILRIVWRYLYYLKGIKLINADEIMKYNKKMLASLNHIMSYLNIKDDKHLAPVIRIFKREISQFLTTIQISSHISDIIRTMHEIDPGYNNIILDLKKEELSTDFVNQSIKTLQSIIDDNQLEVTQEDINQKIKESFLSFEVFTLLLDKKLRGVNFKAIKLFISVTQSNIAFFGQFVQKF